MSLTDGHYDIYSASDVVITINGNRLQHIERIEIHESIISNFRYGMVQYDDNAGEIEFLEIYGGNTICEVRIANAFEKVPRVFHMKIIDVQRMPLSSRAGARNMMTVFSLVEAPLYEFLLNGRMTKSWRNVTATDIVKSVLPLSVLGDKYLEIDADDASFRFDRFICPFWSRSKLLQYLKYYSDDGPMLFYTTTDPDTRKIKVNYKALQKLIAKDAVRDLTASINQNVDTYRNDYSIVYPTWLDIISIIQGERVYNFNFLEGERKKVVYPQKGDYKFNGESGQYMDAISAEYTESAKKVETNSETAAFYSEFSNQFNKVSIDIDPKDAVKAKMLSRFIEKYHDLLEVRLVLPPFVKTMVGESYNISLPSFNEDDANSRDERISGKFLLKNLSHIIYTTDEHVQKYITRATFTRTGYSSAVDDEELKRVT